MANLKAKDSDSATKYIKARGLGTDTDPLIVEHSVVGTIEVSNLPATQQVIGTIEVGNLPTTQAIAGTVEVSNLPINQQVSGTVEVSNLPTTQAIVGTVEVNNFPATQQVIGTVEVGNFPATQQVIGTVEVGNFPTTQQVAGTVAVNNLPQTQQVAGTVGINNFPLTQAISGTVGVNNFPATQVVGGTVGVNNFPATQVVTSNKKRWRDDFNGTSLSSNWNVLQLGSGQSIVVANSELKINTGINADSETIIRSNNRFKVPLNLNFTLYISGVSGRDFYLELVDASGQNYISWILGSAPTSLINKVWASDGNIIGGGRGGSLLNATNNLTGLEIELRPDELRLYSISGGYPRRTMEYNDWLLPNPDVEYFIQIRVKNGAANLSNSAINIPSIFIKELEELGATIVGNKIGEDPTLQIPVKVHSMPSIYGTVYLSGSSQPLPVYFPSTPNVNIGTGSQVLVGALEDIYQDTLAPLAANTTFLGTVRSTGGNKTVLRGWVWSDQNGTFSIEQSFDGSSNFRTIYTNPVSRNSLMTYEIRLIALYYRVRYQNGGTAQLQFQVVSNASSI